jgi:DNA-binding XRE family transcriptional regulator
MSRNGVRRPILERFESHVDRTADDGCHIWTAFCDHDGYGKFWDGTYYSSGQGRHVKAHKWAWLYFVGPIPDDLWVLHRCDNPPCVRIDHLFLGTPGDNSRDMTTKGRKALSFEFDNHITKISNDQVREIRALEGTMLQREIAEMYGVAETTINNILRGRKRSSVI